MTGLYAATVNGHIKVGRSSDIYGRIRRLRSADKDKSAMLVACKPCSVSASFSEENRVLGALADHLVKGCEYHADSPRVMAMLFELGFIAPPKELTTPRLQHIPIKHESGEARLVVFQFRLTEDELKKLHKVAKAQKLTASEYLRKAAHGESHQVN